MPIPAQVQAVMPPDSAGKMAEIFTLLIFPTAFNSMRCSIFSVSYRQCSVFHLFNPLFACTSGRHSNAIAKYPHHPVVSWMDMYFVRKLLSGTISRKIKYCFISLRNFSTILFRFLDPLRFHVYCKQATICILILSSGNKIEGLIKIGYIVKNIIMFTIIVFSFQSWIVIGVYETPHTLLSI